MFNSLVMIVAGQGFFLALSWYISLFSQNTIHVYLILLNQSLWYNLLIHTLSYRRPEDSQSTAAPLYNCPSFQYIIDTGRLLKQSSRSHTKSDIYCSRLRDLRVLNSRPLNGQTAALIRLINEAGWFDVCLSHLSIDRFCLALACFVIDARKSTGKVR